MRTNKKDCRPSRTRVAVKAISRVQETIQRTTVEDA